ncbi:competence/damage-inducible protein A [Halodesulfurarchaeum sp.]|uniref:competence/damage-inducible protein A n=1 Tax=Halodesulfurarchaeum sp. TaxID=1980530 RepID=UPI002FC2D212
MDVGIITVGDELLAGETENTNAAWLARQITRLGGHVKEILTIGDNRELIADRVAQRAARFDRVIVTGGLGGTPDDLTMKAVAEGLDRDLEIDPDAREAAKASSKAFVESHPDLAEKYDLGLDVDRVAETIAGGRVIKNPEGLAQGCAVENVYVLPGVPSELKGTFEQVAGEFEGDVRVETRYTDAPEGVLATHLGTVEDRFAVRAGSYPGERADRNRVRITGDTETAVERAVDWLGERVTLEAEPENGA